MASFKSVLKKIGEVALAGASILPVYGGFARAIALSIPGDKDDAAVDRILRTAADGLVTAQNVIIAMEAAGAAAGIPGPQKAAMTAPALHQLFMTLPILQGKKPKDPAAALLKAQAVGGALADYFNQFED